MSSSDADWDEGENGLERWNADDAAAAEDGDVGMLGLTGVCGSGFFAVDFLS